MRVIWAEIVFHLLLALFVCILVVLTVGADIIIQIELCIKLNANRFFMVVEADNVCASAQWVREKRGTKFEFENVFQYHEICIMLCVFPGICHFAQFMCLVICEFGTFFCFH